MGLHIGLREIVTAAITVADETQIGFFAQRMDGYGVKILSTGCTADRIKKANVEIEVVESISEFPRIGVDINLVAVNFERLSSDANLGIDVPAVIAGIDIKRSNLMRLAASQFEEVAVVYDVKGYDRVIRDLDAYNGVTMETRTWLATRAFNRVSEYDQAITSFLNKRVIVSNGSLIRRGMATGN